MANYNITLPNGKVLKDVPEGTPPEVVQDAAIELGLATIQDFDEDFVDETVPQAVVPTSKPQQFPANPRVRGSTVRNREEGGGVGQFLQENMELPLGIGGSLGGMAAGSVFGPVGTVVGGILGGAAGSAGGSLVSDELTGEDLDYGKAVEEALISAGFDVATLGVGSKIKPAFVAAQKALGFSARETADQIITQGASVGTKDSLRATQQILSEGGASLTPFQVGAAGVSVLNEKIARAGLLSSGTIAANEQAVNEIAKESLSEVVNKLSVNVDGSSEDIANALYDVVVAGKSALSENYVRALDDLAEGTKNVRVPIGGFIYKLNNFVTRNQGELVNALDKDTIKYIDDLKLALGENMGRTVPFSEVITIDKMITRDISSKFGNPNSDLYNTVVEAQLSELSSELKGVVQKALSKGNPEAASKYSDIKKAYSEGIQGILPDINKNFINNASVGNFKSLGNLLAKAGNINQVMAFKKSLKSSFDEIDKAGKKTAGPFIALEEAEALIKKGFLNEKFPDLMSGEFNIQTYKNLANKLENKTEASKWKAVLGEDYPRVKQIVNLMSEAAQKPQSNIGELVLRNKEYQALGAAATLFSGPVGMGAGLSAIFVPQFLAKAATNPKHVNKLLAYNNKKFLSIEDADKALSFIISDVVDEMTEEEVAEFKNYIRKSTSK